MKVCGEKEKERNKEREPERNRRRERVKAGLVQVGFRQSVCYFRRAEGGRMRERDG